ncbi:putative S-adenosylmethionine-dependent methyltransferase of the seven beta-strand family [Whalleya microplaca]|nr:putative S-adenosylmethionine-dependent methyltransferase of the seven beta-strand family [Whalleya microplaca]
MSKPTHLEPSELGTKEYWDNLYTTELTNHAHDPSDTGTVWFDDSDAEAKIIAFLSTPPITAYLDNSHPPERTTTAFLDLGTGNGSLLFRLRDAGWAGRMLGVDYSEASVAFAKRLASARISDPGAAGSGEKERAVEFRTHDVLTTPPSALLTGEQKQGWDVVLDKGTFDAISLSAETDARGRRVGEGYRGRVLPLVRGGGLFVVTSCNWTEEELRGWFEGGGGGNDGDGDGGENGEEGDGDGGENGDGGWTFKQIGRVEYRTFSFGGVKGQTISTLCFQKIKAGSVGS